MQTVGIEDQIVGIKRRVTNNEKGIRSILIMDAKATQDLIDIGESLKSICTNYPDTEGYCRKKRLSFQPLEDGTYQGGRKRSRKKRRKTRRKKRRKTRRKKRRKTRRKKRRR